MNLTVQHAGYYEPLLRAVWRGREDAIEPLTNNEIRVVVEGVRRLSGGLTRERALVGTPYMEDRALLGAYLLFYWPISYLQARSIIHELRPPGPRGIDLGSGPGPVALAGLDAGMTSMDACDQSARALDAAQQIAIATNRQLTLRDWNSRSRPWPGGAVGKYDLVSAGHLLNELADPELRWRVAREAMTHLSPQGSFVIIEPALRETSRGLLELRDRLIDAGHSIEAPCFFKGPCPALLRASDWCHAERAVDLPEGVAELAEAASLHKEILKFSYLVVRASRVDPDPPAPRYRIVSELLENKGRSRYLVCGPDGRAGMSQLHRHQTPDNQPFTTLKRGDAIDVHDVRHTGDGWAIGPESRVVLAARAGERLPAEGNTESSSEMLPLDPIK